MESSPQATVTRLLAAYGSGRHEALDRLMPLLYDELHALAGRHMAKERASHTLSTTELVHEAYLNLVDQTQVGPQNRRHFFAIASRVMRNLLIDYARRHTAQKRGGTQRPTSLDGKQIAVEERAEELLALDAALDRLAHRDERIARVVQYRFFGGLTLKETAHLLDVSVMTVHRDWKRAKAWLYDDLNAA